MSLEERSLCHPDKEKSCGLCCGCYNSPDFFYASTMARLRGRTKRFHALADPTDQQTLDNFKARELAIQHKLVTDVPNCPFVGFLDAAEDAKIGCLVHPMQLGVDRRDCGVYDRETCEDFLCASHSVLTTDQIALVIASVHDSYTYGLVITDPNFVRALFDQVADVNHRAMDSRDVRNPRVIAEAERFFSLKVDWPYGTDDAILGQAFVGDDLETIRRPMPADPTPWDNIVMCLGTRIDDPRTLESARRQVERRVRGVAAAAAQGR